MTQSQKDFFLDTCSTVAGSGKYRVYAESDFPGDQIPFTAGDLTTTFMCASMSLPDGRGDVLFFEQQNDADDFAQRLQGNARFRLVEGPVLTK